MQFVIAMERNSMKQTKQLDAKIYTTYFVARNHNDFIKDHMEECQQIFVMSKFWLATEDTLTIPFMEGYFEDQVQPDFVHDSKRYWEVIDRTYWRSSSRLRNGLSMKKTTRLRLKALVPFHEYTVSFLVYAIWDPTQMYNHITNNWGDVPTIFHLMYVDLIQINSCTLFKTMVKDNPDTDVVRFTTFFYHFTLIFNNLGKKIVWIWSGYGASVSVAALGSFC